MECVVCGCSQEIEIHGHTQCAQCGRVLDGDCCQGSQQNESVKEKIYRENRVCKEFENLTIDKPNTSPKSI